MMLPKAENVKVWTAPFWFVTQWVLVIAYRRFGTDSLETSVRNYRHSLSNDPEERNSHPLRGGRPEITQRWLCWYRTL